MAIKRDSKRRRTKAKRSRNVKIRGLFEKVAGSGVWWIHWHDSTGRRHREKAGSKSAAVKLYQLRKTHVLEQRKLPKLRRTVVPLLADYSKRFLDGVRTECAAKPKTITFYEQQVRYLLQYEPLNRPLDEINKGLIGQFIQHRRRKVSIATTNRGLATLRRMLRLAQEWEVIDRVPKIRLLRGEHNREFVLSREQEHVYLEFAPDPLHDAALLMLDEGLGPAEALALEWIDIHPDYLQVREGKTEHRPRKLVLTSRVRKMLERRRQDNKKKSRFVFPGKGRGHFRVDSLDHMHTRARQQLRLPADFVLYCMRHTALTRLGEAGADAYTIMRIAGHSTITTSQKYVHPSTEAVGLAIARLDAANLATATTKATSTHGPLVTH